MSHAITFDTLAFAKKLESSGMEAKYAEGFSEALSEVFDHSRETVATKQDVVLSENSTKQEITLLRAELNAVKSELKSDISNLKAELKTVKSELKSEMIMWIVGLLFAQTAIMVSIMKFIH
jgi:cell shape-determining protein MreC